jgi:ATP-dependent DNA helicase RecQ
LSQLLRSVNAPRGQVEQALKLLELDGAVARVGSRYTRTPTPWRPDDERIARVVAARRLELEQMRGYMTHDGCLMEYLVRLLDDPDARPCGRCSNDRGRGLSREVDPALVSDAVTFLRRDLRPIGTRRMWPEAAVSGMSGRIDPPNEPGIALSVYGDAGWGRAVADGKYRSGSFSEALVRASAAAIRDRWKPLPAPEWVTAIPSAKRGLVGDFAAALAAEIGLPYVECLSVRADAPPQKTMENSAQQLRNVHGKLAVDEPPVLGGPVLLVDDIIDSGWTLTYAGWLLRGAGCGPIHPFALAVASSRGA